MFDYILPVLACLATIIAVFSQVNEPRRAFRGWNITLIVVAVLTLGVTEWLVYQDNITLEERRSRIDTISQQLNTAQQDRRRAIEKLDAAEEERGRLSRKQQDLSKTLEEARSERLKTFEKLVSAREKIGKLQADLREAGEEQLVRSKVVQCENLLSQRRDFALFVGLFRNGYTENRLDLPTDSDVEFYNKLMDGDYNGTRDEAMMTAVGDWPNHRFPRSYDQFSAFHAMEKDINQLGCRLKWRTSPQAGYDCDCSVE